ncbi:Eukaryotic initiation factor 4A-I-like protein, partial [Leptotrombidium deliense]
MASKSVMKSELAKNALTNGLTKPTVMQFRVFLASKTGFNVLVQMKINSEVLFVVSFIIAERVCENDTQCQAIVLTPNCQLANEMQSVNNSLCTSQSTLKDDIEAVSESVHVIIGTVGRIYDLISIGSISLRDVKLCFILDWESFDSNEVKDILSLFPDTVQ